MRQRLKAWGGGILLAALISPGAAQNRIGTKFADVIMEQVIPGKLYNLRTMRNLPYRVNNESAGPVDLKITVEIPQKDSLKPGYEAIPDPARVQIVPSNMKLKEGEQGLADIILQVHNTERMRLLAASGNLGLGTAVPSERLEINGNIANTAGTLAIYTRDYLVSRPKNAAGAVFRLMPRDNSATAPGATSRIRAC